MSSRRGSGCYSEAAMVLQSALRGRPIPADRVARLQETAHAGIIIGDGASSGAVLKLTRMGGRGSSAAQDDAHVAVPRA